MQCPSSEGPLWRPPESKARIQLNSKSLEEFATVVRQVPHGTLVCLPDDFIQRVVAYAFFYVMKDPGVKHLPM